MIIQIIFIFFVLFEMMTVISAASRGIVLFLSGTLFSGDPAVTDQWIFIAGLLSTSLIIVLVTAYCKFVEKRSIASVGLRKEGSFKQYFTGLGIGGLAISTVVGICYVAGAVTCKGVVFSDILMYVLICVGWMIQGAEEEIVFRGWFMTSLSNCLPIWAAVLINSLFFSLAHLLNAGFNLQTFASHTLFGIWLSLLAIRCGSVIPCCGVHTIWNLAQSCIFGFPVGGDMDIPSVLRFSFSQNRGNWMNWEIATIIEMAVLILITWFFPVLTNKRKCIESTKNLWHST